ncbi:hypothetical protein SAMN02745116_01368 [Pilibacter termitis]|jgi:hypothetical protein|uniref:Uncharacterized protein n=1 Tax=Pilibacter termitis TaxID=263852 RepID=A0A1T4NBK6_9ENTE|nr:hypothetical protein [Pilibacter termitis]SJZ76659.1 hypothetical protein SAMN02745116_01368 [Pilibacter termitis]
MKNKHKISGLVDKFYMIVMSSTRFWWILLKNGIVYGVLAGIFAMHKSEKLALEKQRVVSLCWSSMVILTITSFLLIGEGREFMAILFLSLLVLTSLSTIYLYEVVNLVGEEKKGYQEIYAQAFLNMWKKFPIKICFFALGLCLLKLNLIAFVFIFPRVYQLLLMKMILLKKTTSFS